MNMYVQREAGLNKVVRTVDGVEYVVFSDNTEDQTMDLISMDQCESDGATYDAEFIVTENFPYSKLQKGKAKQLVKFEDCKLLLGFSIIGEAARIGAETTPYLLMGLYDTQVKYSLYYKEYDNKYPEKESDLDDPRLDSLLENLKKYIRVQLQDAFDKLEQQELLDRVGDRLQKQKQERYERKQEAKRKRAVAQSIKDTYKPSEQGTVSEIAEKLGISKSEVRRRRKEGTL